MLKENEICRDSFIEINDSKMLKGIAILMMVSMHLMKSQWIINPEKLIDVCVFGTTLADVLADSVHASTSIFAFITGYVWAWGYSKNKPVKRIFELYMSYWVITLLVNLPFKELDTYLQSRQLIEFTMKSVLGAVFAVSSEISMFCWYISFFAAAVITYPLLRKLTACKLVRNTYVKIILMVIFFLGLRAILKILLRGGIINGEVQQFFSMYCATMPKLMIGSVVAENCLYDKWYENKLFKGKFLKYSIIFMLGIILLGIFIRFTLGIGADLQSIWIVFEMFALTIIVKELSKVSEVKIILQTLGDYSLYIWLIHAIFLLKSVQKITYSLRIPILIILFAVVTSFMISILLKKLDCALKKAIGLSGKNASKI